MKRATLGLVVGLCVALACATVQDVRGREVVAEEDRPLIQMAILLDTSGSMSGLIDQARTQIWKIVNEFATTEKDGRIPQFRVALYEYGKSSLPQDEGYMRMILPLTTDLDKVSEELFALKTNGGSEYCGMVIKRAAENLQWSGSNDDLKVIFIAGNEPFTQGSVDYKKACKAAISKGIVVNTIHCGAEKAGIDGKWKHGAQLADGSYMCINQNRQVVHIDAPQDEEIARLGRELNDTYVPYGAAGEASRDRQLAQDANAARRATAGAQVQRMVAKAGPQYENAGWDLVDALREEKVKLEEMEEEALPEELREMSPEERKAYIEQQAARRAEIQQKIKELNAARQKYVAKEREKLTGSEENTLDQVMIATLREQAARKGFEAPSEEAE